MSSSVPCQQFTNEFLAVMVRGLACSAGLLVSPWVPDWAHEFLTQDTSTTVSQNLETRTTIEPWGMPRGTQ